MSAPREAVCGAREGEGEDGIERWLMLTSLPVMRERERNREEEREVSGMLSRVYAKTPSRLMSGPGLEPQLGLCAQDPGPAHLQALSPAR